MSMVCSLYMIQFQYWSAPKILIQRRCEFSGILDLDSLWQSNQHLLSQPAQLASVVSKKLAPLISDAESGSARFATAIFGLLDLKKMCLVLSFAGGPAPFMFRSDGNLETLQGTGFPLGLSVDVEYEEHIVPIHPGDCLLAFTDGVEEIRIASGEFLGAQGLERILKEVSYPASNDFKAIEEKLLRASDRIRFSDDLTFLEMRLT